MIRAAALVAALASLGCGAQSERCDDATFCPADTTCGGAGACLVEPGACDRFAERTPCLVDDELRGACTGEVCVPGVTVIGAVAALPDSPLPGVHVTALGHPEVPEQLTNINGYYGLSGVPRDTVFTIALSFEGTVPVITHAFATTDTDLYVDESYGHVPIITEATADLLLAQIGLVRRRGLAGLYGLAFNPETSSGVEGVTVAVEGTTCDGPFYVDANGTAHLGGATDPRSSAFAFINCAPGPATVTAMLPGTTCRSRHTSSTAIELELVPDHLTFTGRVVCD